MLFLIQVSYILFLQGNNCEFQCFLFFFYAIIFYSQPSFVYVFIILYVIFIINNCVLLYVMCKYRFKVKSIGIS